MLRFGTGLGLAVIAVCSLRLGVVGAQEDAAKPEFYTARVKPIFEANCAKCHLDGNHRGGLNMDTREAMLKGGRDGSVLVPGDLASPAPAPPAPRPATKGKALKR